MAINLNGNAESTYSSDISAAAGTFSGDLSVAIGTFSGDIELQLLDLYKSALTLLLVILLQAKTRQVGRELVPALPVTVITRLVVQLA